MTAGNPIAPVSCWRQVARNLLHQPVFLAAAIVLSVAAIGLNGATQFMKLHWKKEPVPLRAALEVIPDTLGNWTCALKDQSLDPELVSTLDTHEFIFRWYVRVADAGEPGTYVPRSVYKEMFKDEMSFDERKKAVEALTLNPAYHDVVVNLAVTYYTGKADTVAHIPERCYTAAGRTKLADDQVTWDVRDKMCPDGKIVAQLDDFQTPGQNQVQRVAYFFNCNGAYTNDSFVVRAKLQNLFARYGYYAKVEMMTVVPGTSDRSKTRPQTEAAMTELLISALPEIEKCLPDWASLAH